MAPGRWIPGHRGDRAPAKSSLPAAQRVAVRGLAEALTALSEKAELDVLMEQAWTCSRTARFLFRVMQTAGLESVPSLATAPPT